MQDSTRIRFSGRALPLRGNDIDTDRIIPARFLKTVVFDGLGEHSFEDDRLGMQAEGKLHAADDPRFFEATILLVNKNFGCGSSREHAPQAIVRFRKGIRLIIGESFAEIFYGNCISLGVPCPTLSESAMNELMTEIEKDPTLELTVDLSDKSLTAGERRYDLGMPEGPRQQFLSGTWDSTAELLANLDAVRETAKRLPYLSNYG